MSILLRISLMFAVSAGKGFWAEKLGVGDFYYELAVQIVEVRSRLNAWCT